MLGHLCVHSILLVLLLLVYTTACYPQEIIQKQGLANSAINLQSLIVGRYGVSLTENLDYTGLHHIANDDENQKIVRRSFEMQYVRLSTSFKINNRFSGAILVNLADFKYENLTNRILENAFINYAGNDYFNLRLGQFRPYFGLEDSYPFQLNNSYKWSNQYSLFGQNTWQSFQIGAAVYGNLLPQKIPVYYYFTAYNGRIKNNFHNKPNTENYALRFEYFPLPYLQLGINGAVANYENRHANAYGIDAKLSYFFNKNWKLDMHTEYKNGTNFLEFEKANQEVNEPLKNYRSQGMYVLFHLKYAVNNSWLQALEFSFREEYLDENIQKSGRILREHIPMLSLVYVGDYSSKLSLVGVISDYQTNIPGSRQYDGSKILIQYQIAFK